MVHVVGPEKKDGASLDEILNGLGESLVMHDFFCSSFFFTDLGSRSKNLEEGFVSLPAQHGGHDCTRLNIGSPGFGDLVEGTSCHEER